MNRRPREIDYDAIERYIIEYWSSFMSSPSIRDVMAGCNLSSTSVTDYVLKALAEDGKIVFRNNNRARQIIPMRVYSSLREALGG